MADFDWSSPEPSRGDAPGDEPDVFQTVLPNGLHIRYSSEEELEAAARLLGPEASRRAALLNALRKRHEG